MKNIIRKVGSLVLGLSVCWIAIVPKCSIAVEPPQAPSTFSIVIDVSGSMNDAFPAPVQADLADGKQKILGVKRRLIRLARYVPLNTRVIVTTFDHQVRRVCDLTITDEAGRQKLVEAFESIQAGNGATLLWRTLDANLQEAISISKANPEGSVRLLIYTDGDDSEKSPAYTLDTILAKYASELRDTLQLDWVTLGFDMKPEDKIKLEQANVRITTAHTLEDIVPLQASFELSKEQVRTGEQVTLHSTSLGLDIKDYTTDWGDGSAYEVGEVLNHSYKQPGEYKIRMTVRDAKGRRQQTNKSIRVLASDPPKVSIELEAQQVTLGEPIHARAKCADQDVQFQWFVEGAEIANGKFFTWTARSTGVVKLTLKSSDKFAQTSSQMVTVNVTLPQAPIASFRVVPERPKPGDQLSLINESSPTAVRFQWTLNGEVTETKHALFVAKGFGPVTFQLKVWDKFEQVAETRQTIEIAKPDAPKAQFELPEKLELRQTGSAVDTSLGEIPSAGWYVDGKKVGEGKVLTISFEQPGQHIVRREVINAGGTSSIEKTVMVMPMPLPVAGFTLGAEQAYLGDSITVTDIARNGLRSSFYVGDHPQPITIEAAASARHFSVDCAQLGELRIRQVVENSSGTDEVTQNILIKSRFTPARPRFTMTYKSLRAPTTVTFPSQSSGDIIATWFDPGDGSPVQQFEGAPKLSHTYHSAGEFNPVIRVASAVELGLPPAEWRADAPLRIARPWSAWVRNLWWEAPAGFLMVAVGLVGYSRHQRKRRRDRLIVLEGVLSYVHKNGKRGKHTFAGKYSTEVIPLDNDEQFIVTASLLGGNLVEKRIELMHAGEPVAADCLEENSNVGIGEYRVSYI